MAQHDWTPADLARETGMSGPTIRGYTSGTTRAICNGTIPPRYPTEPALAICHTAQLLNPRQAAALAELLDAILAGSADGA
jgi:hypothetical protein